MDKERKKESAQVHYGYWRDRGRKRGGGGGGEDGGGVGEVGGMLYELSKGKKIALAVPTKGWVRGMRELIPKEYNVLSITGGQKNERELEKMCNYDVLIYNSAISAGHSIDIKDHFDSVFLVVNSPTPNGRWVTARIDEMFQMAARVRNPITKKIYITTDTFHYRNKACTVNGDEEYYSAAMKSGFDILMSGRNIVPNQLAAMCKSEFEVLVLDWITTKAFPGSIITEEYLNGSQTAEVVLNNDHVFSIQADQFHLAVIEDSLSNPKKYIDCVAGVRRRKAVPVDVFYENEEHIAALKALPYIEYFDSKRQVEVRMLQ